MSTTQQDNYLIDQFLLGDPEGFNMLVRKYQNRVINTVFSLIGTSPQADDIAQDVFVKVHNNLRFFNRKSGFSTWLYRITINTTYNYLKKENKYVQLDRFPQPQSSTVNNLQGIESRERQEIVSNAIARLPFKYRTVVVLKDIEGLSYQDIAKTLGCRIGTVESRLFRARKILKTLLAPLFEKEY